MSCERALEQKHRLFYRFLHFNFHMNYFSFTHPTFRHDRQRVLEILCSSHQVRKKKKKPFSPSLSNFSLPLSLNNRLTRRVPNLLSWTLRIVSAYSRPRLLLLVFLLLLLLLLVRDVCVLQKKKNTSLLSQDLWPRPTRKCFTLTGVDKTLSAAPGSSPSGVTSLPPDSPPSDRCLHSCGKMLFFFPDMNFKWKSNRWRKCFSQEKQITKWRNTEEKKRKRLLHGRRRGKTSSCLFGRRSTSAEGNMVSRRPDNGDQVTLVGWKVGQSKRGAL